MDPFAFSLLAGAAATMVLWIVLEVTSLPKARKAEDVIPPDVLDLAWRLDVGDVDWYVGRGIDETNGGGHLHDLILALQVPAPSAADDQTAVHVADTTEDKDCGSDG